MHLKKSWFSSGAPKPDKGKTAASLSTPASNELEKAVSREGEQHEEGFAESLMAVRKTTLTRRKVVVCSVALVIMLALLLIPVLFCGVFQEAKDMAEDHSTGIVLQNYTVVQTSSPMR